MKKIKTIKNKMFLYSITIVAVMGILSVYALSITNGYQEQIDTMFKQHIELMEIEERVEKVDKELVSFLSSKSSNSLQAYMIEADKLREITNKSLFELSYIQEELMLKDIMHMIDSYINIGDRAISAKRKRDVSKYALEYEKFTNIKSYINKYITDLNMGQFSRNSENYIVMSKEIKTLQRITVLMILDAIFISILIVYNMSNRMIKPIVRLSYSAEEIAKGRFDSKEIYVNTDDELKILANAFNKMKINIKKYIEELKNKAATETKLKDQQMENMKMQHLLESAKLYALQSQINPHFLFNTINAAVQMSMLEGANRTSDFLESMSRLFRYNIKEIDSEVTLKQEIENLKDYYELLKVRFGDLIEFEFKIDEKTLHLIMPPLILQPIVENAYIYGLSEKENGGKIVIETIYKNGTIIISIEDNGKGMASEKVDRLLAKKISENQDNKSTGIGMSNVISRLELFYKTKNLIRISSKIGKGTKVTITI